MRFIFFFFLSILVIPPAWAQSPDKTTGAADASAPVPQVAPKKVLTKLLCKPYCDKAGFGPLSGSELDQFNACADAQLCNEGYPPVAVDKRPIDLEPWLQPQRHGG